MNEYSPLWTLAKIIFDAEFELVEAQNANSGVFETIHRPEPRLVVPGDMLNIHNIHSIFGLNIHIHDFHEYL